MSSMNLALQKHNLNKALDRAGFTDFDAEGYLDASLSYKENLERVEDQLGIDLTTRKYDLNSHGSIESDGNKRLAADHVMDFIQEHGWCKVIDMMQEKENKTLNDIASEFSEDFILSVIHEKHGVERKTILSRVYNMEENLKQLIEDNSDYRDAVEKILEHERDEELHERNGEVLGWKHDDVGVNPGRLVRLQSQGIVEKTEETSSASFYLLLDPEKVEEVLHSQNTDPEVDESSAEEDIELVEDVDVTPSEEDIKEFKEIVEEHDALEYWFDHVNPKVEEMKEAKQAILVSEASLDDMHGDRFRIHVLLHGDKGTGKSALSTWQANKLGHNHVGKRTTDVGLTGDMRGDEPTPGALPNAHGQHLIVEELDEFDRDDRGGALESMSEGVVSLTGGGSDVKFHAEATITATANRTEDWRPELLDRFDFRIECEQPNKDQGSKIVKGRVDSFGREKKDYEGKKLRKYLQWVREFEPEMPDDVREEVKDLLDTYIQKNDDDSIEVRQYERFIRIAHAIARLNHRDVRTEDVMRAIDLATDDTLMMQPGTSL